MKKYDVIPNHLDGIVNQLSIPTDVKIAVFSYENERNINNFNENLTF